MMYFRKVVQELEKASSVFEKRKILQKALLHDEYTIETFLHAVYDPYRQYNITHGKAMKRGEHYPPQVKDINTTLFRCLDLFRTRQSTGQDALDLWFNFMQTLPRGLSNFAGRILNKDLKCGLGLKTVNKVLVASHLDPIGHGHGVGWQKIYKEQPIWADDDDWYISRKIKGIRCYIIIGRDRPFCLSPQGQSLSTLSVLENAFKFYKGPPILLDGKLALRRKNGKDYYKGLMSQVFQKEHQIENISFNLFDIINLQAITPSFGDRMIQMKEFVEEIDTNILKRVKHIKIKSERHFKSLTNKAQAKRWEGVVLRKNAPYKPGRSNDLLLRFNNKRTT